MGLGLAIRRELPEETGVHQHQECALGRRSGLPQNVPLHVFVEKARCIARVLIVPEVILALSVRAPMFDVGRCEHCCKPLIQFLDFVTAPDVMGPTRVYPSRCSTPQ